MIGSQGSVVRTHGNCFSLLAHPHTQRVFIIASLCICPFFTQQLSILSLSWLLPFTELQLVCGVSWAISHPDALLLFSCSVMSDSVTPWTAACQASFCDPMDCSILGFPALHHLPELAQTTSIELVMSSSHLILCHPPSPPAFNLSQHQGLFQ